MEVIGRPINIVVGFSTRTVSIYLIIIMRKANKNNIKTLLPPHFVLFKKKAYKTLDTQLVRAQAYINALKSLAASPPNGVRVVCKSTLYKRMFAPLSDILYTQPCILN